MLLSEEGIWWKQETPTHVPPGGEEGPTGLCPRSDANLQGHLGCVT